jgi:hypothetical protein
MSPDPTTSQNTVPTEGPPRDRQVRVLLSAAVKRLRRAVHDEACSGLRLERGADTAVGIEIVRPCRASPQGKDAVLHRI